MKSELPTLRDLIAKWRHGCDICVEKADDLECWLDQAETELSTCGFGPLRHVMMRDLRKLFGTKEETHAKRLSDTQATRG